MSYHFRVPQILSSNIHWAWRFWSQCSLGLCLAVLLFGLRRSLKRQHYLLSKVCVGRLLTFFFFKVWMQSQNLKKRNKHSILFHTHIKLHAVVRTDWLGRLSTGMTPSVGVTGSHQECIQRSPLRNDPSEEKTETVLFSIHYRLPSMQHLLWLAKGCREKNPVSSPEKRVIQLKRWDI